MNNFINLELSKLYPGFDRYGINLAIILRYTYFRVISYSDYGSPIRIIAS